MSELPFERSVVQHAPEIGATEAIRNFDFKTILIILTGSSLGESHVAAKIRDVVNHVLGTTATLDSPEEISRALEDTIEAILSQYPELSALHTDGEPTVSHIAARLAGDTPDITISLKSLASD